MKTTKFNILSVLIIIIIGLTITDIAYYITLKKTRFNNSLLNEKMSLAYKEKMISDSLTYHQLKQKYLFEQNIYKDTCKKLFKNESKILYLFSVNSCYQCIEKNFMDFNLISEKIGKEKIILVGDFADRVNFEDFLSQFQYESYKRVLLHDIINVNDLDLKVPLFLILDYDYNISAFFYDHTENDKIKKLSLENFIERETLSTN